MRLICPNCGAQYEVDDSVIPEDGRDVQCSGCGHGWFQPGKSALAEAEAPETTAPEPDGWDAGAWEAEPEAAPEAQPPAPEPMPEPAAAPEPAPEPAAPVADDIEDAIAAMLQDEGSVENPPGTAALSDYCEDSDYDESLSAAPAPGTTPRRPLDDDLLSILREEAERESAQRRAEGTTLETQEDLGLGEPVPPVRPVEPAVPAEPAPREDDAPSYDPELFADLDAEEPEPVPRGRERLPDIEEINSTLTAASDRVPRRSMAADDEADQASGGFRTGFSLVMLIALAGLSLYFFAAQIIALVPQLEGALTAYVTTVDTLRLSLDQLVQGLIERFSEKG